MNLAYAITIAAALVVVARLLTFRRRGRYRPGVAITAWLIIVAMPVAAVYGPPVPELARWLIAAAMVALAIALIRTGGNVAHLIRPLRRQ
ncbi:phage holin family protein [Vreelandella neptunia]|uniref:Phage holin family protein n=1 Tax=Vreelandella neptunia TaxID=115551 RepID=A0ABZ0YJ94_9GAMM|nr:phage holin family protein [Halomonas neptunia]MDN3562106.1 phage holin family protein [Halomonas neptunia]WQH11808.1 phage holin family protein [Halomonas neptunia]